jgi:hypothetical protein
MSPLCSRIKELRKLLILDQSSQLKLSTLGNVNACLFKVIIQTSLAARTMIEN